MTVDAILPQATEKTLMADLDLVLPQQKKIKERTSKLGKQYGNLYCLLRHNSFHLMEDCLAFSMALVGVGWEGYLIFLITWGAFFKTMAGYY